VLVVPTGHAAPLLVPCTARLDRTGTTGRSRLVAKRPPQCDSRNADGQCLSGGTAVTVVLRGISVGMGLIESYSPDSSSAAVSGAPVISVSLLKSLK
jgi:hypothetical protein